MYRDMGPERPWGRAHSTGVGAVQQGLAGLCGRGLGLYDEGGRGITRPGGVSLKTPLVIYGGSLYVTS